MTDPVLSPKDPDKDSEPLSPERKELLKKRISGWLRQSRYRARKSNVEVDVSFQEVVDIYEEYDYHCAYCGSHADSPDHPFPIRDRGPCVPANVVPCCNNCRNLKKNHNLIRFYQDGHLTEDTLHAIIKSMVVRKGGADLRNCIKKTIGPNEIK